MRIRCTLDSQEGFVQLAIADEGAGMSEDQLARLFGRFEQGPREGIGLGLAFVRTVVDRHGAEISCESKQGRGTCFTLHFRQSDADPYQA